MKRLLDYCSVSGKNVPQFDGIKKYVATGDVINNRITSYENVDYKNKPSRANQIADSNEVLFAKMKDTKKVLLINEKTAKNIYSTGFFVIKANLNVLPEYLYWLFNSKKFNQDKDKNSKGATQKAINLEGLGKIMIKEIPSLDKQKKIISKINRCNEIIELKKEQLDELEKLIKSQFVEMFGDVASNSKGYPVVKLSEISEYWNGLTYKPTDISEDGMIVLRSSNIQDGQLDFQDIVRVKRNINDKKIVHDNDILMCSRNGSARLVGKVALIKEQSDKMSFGAFMMIIRSAYYPYLLNYFQTDAFRTQISTGATTTINQITSNMMNNVKLPLPDKDKIMEFEKFVEHIDKLEFVKIMKRDSATRLEYVEKFV